MFRVRRGNGCVKNAHSGRCNLNMTLEKYTVGVGDRFAHQAEAQLQACVQLAADGIEVVPVWNKSNREHSFIGSQPQSVYDAATAAVEALGWEQGRHPRANPAPSPVPPPPPWRRHKRSAVPSR